MDGWDRIDEMRWMDGTRWMTWDGWDRMDEMGWMDGTGWIR